MAERVTSLNGGHIAASEDAARDTRCKDRRRNPAAVDIPRVQRKLSGNSQSGGRAVGQFVANLWNGKTFSVAKHYWLFLVVPGVVFTVLTKALEFNSLSFTPTSYGWVSGILWTIAVMVFVVGYVGLINCARFRSFRGWSAIAVGVTTLSLIGAILKTVAEFSGNPVNEVQQLYDEASAINVQVPKKVDAITTLTKAEYRDDVFTYYYDIDQAAYQSPNWSTDKAKVTIKANACETFKGSVGTAALRSVRYVYKADGKDVFVVEVGGRDCEPAH
jgi:hypothetical protein